MPQPSPSHRRSLSRQVVLLAALNMLIGGWLVASAWVLDFAPGDAVWNPVVCGALVVAIALTRMTGARNHGSLSLLNACIGAWLISTGYWLAESAPATISITACGGAIVLIALWNASVGEVGSGATAEPPRRQSVGGAAGGVLAVSALLAGLVWLAFVAAGDDEFEPGISVEDVAEAPAALAGRSVLLLGEVEETGDGAFILEGGDGSEIIVVTDDAMPDVDGDELVQVFGVVRDRDDLDPPRDLGEDAGEGAVVATFVDEDPFVF